MLHLDLTQMVPRRQPYLEKPEWESNKTRNKIENNSRCADEK